VRGGNETKKKRTQQLAGEGKCVRGSFWPPVLGGRNSGKKGNFHCGEGGGCRTKGRFVKKGVKGGQMERGKKTYDGENPS